MIEDVCEHGCGHPNKTWMNSKENKNQDGYFKETTGAIWTR